MVIKSSYINAIRYTYVAHGGNSIQNWFQQQHPQLEYLQ